MMHKILIVDDSQADRRIYRRFLDSQNEISLQIFEAKTGAEALQLHQAQTFHCIILDYRLPDKTGLQILPKLQEIHPVPVIFISGQAEPLVMTDAYRHGVVRYISKDFLHSRELTKAVKDALD